MQFEKCETIRCSFDNSHMFNTINHIHLFIYIIQCRKFALLKLFIDRNIFVRRV